MIVVEGSHVPGSVWPATVVVCGGWMTGRLKMGMLTRVWTGSCLVDASTYDFTGQNVTLLKKYPKSNFLDCHSMFIRFSAPKKGGVLIKTFSKGSFTLFFKKNGPGGGGLSDFTRPGTNYLHTTLLKTYRKAIFWTAKVFHLDSAPPKWGGPHKNIFKRLIYPFFPENGPPGGGAF